jgi:antitoxin HicB
VTDAQRYPAQVFYSEEDEGFIAVATDLPGCSAFGDTQEQAVAELRDAIDAWRMAAEKAGNPVPAPSQQHLDELPSGKILLRLPRTLHAQLIDQAKHENVSLNQHLVFVLTASTSSVFMRTAATMDAHRELNWNRYLFAGNASPIYQGGNYRMLLIHTQGHGVNWSQSSAEQSVPKLVGYSPMRASANG